MSLLDPFDKSTVMSLDVTDSKPVELVELKVMKGTGSLLVMVYVCSLSDPRTAFVGLDKVTMTVSSASMSVSSTMSAILITPDV